MGYRDDLTLDDFDDMLAEASGKPSKPKAPKLTSYGPVDPLAAPINIPAPTSAPYRPVSYPAPITMPRYSAPAPAPYYPVSDPMPRASALVHGVLLFTTGGIGNIFYQLYIIDKRNAWRHRHNIY